MSDLDLRVEISDGDQQLSDGERQHYKVVLRGPDGRAVAGSVSLPLRDLQALAEQVPDAVIVSSSRVPDAADTSSIRVRRAESPEEEPMRKLGTMLFDAVLGHLGLAMYQDCRRQAAREERALRVVLEVQPPELARLPWEFMFDTTQQAYLALDVALLRSPIMDDQARTLLVEGPLRVLGMAALPGDQQELAAVGEEQRRLGEALEPLIRARRVELDWVEGQTWRDLREKVHRGGWHVLHFIGHGGFDETAKEGMLALESERGGRTQWLGAAELGIILGKEKSMRLVVLNACDTGRASALDEFSSMGGALLRGGTPAVVAMQHAITDEAALEFSRAFYKELARQQPVEQCVTEARTMIRLASRWSLEWGTPVLYMRSPDGRLFDLAADQREKDLAKSYAVGHAAAAAGRWDEAVELLEEVVTAEPGHGEARQLLEDVRREQEAARLRARATALHRAGDWQSVLNVGERLTALQSSYSSDPDGLIASARAGLRAESRARSLADAHQRAWGDIADREWDQALRELTAIEENEPGYGMARQLLEHVRLEQEAARLRAEAAALHRAGDWQSVLNVGERLTALQSYSSDPDGLIASARVVLEAERRAPGMADAHQRILRYVDDGKWNEAWHELVAIRKTEPGNRDIEELADRIRRGLARVAGISTHPAKPTTIPVGKEMHAVAFSRIGDRLAAGCAGGQALIADLTGRGQHQIRVGGWRTDVTGVAFDPSGRLLATASHKGAHLWDVDAGAQRIQVDHESFVQGVAFSPDGHRLATASRDGTARVWDAVTGAQLLSLTHDANVWSVAFSSDGGRLATGSWDGTARVWDAATGTPLLELTDGLNAPICCVAFSPDSRLLATACQESVRLWDTGTGCELIILDYRGVRQAHDGIDRGASSVAFSPDGRLIAAVGKDKSIRLWQLREGSGPMAML